MGQKMANVIGKPPHFWSKEEVRQWINWCINEYSLNLDSSQLDKFSMNGKALLMLQREDFCDRAPGIGDVIFNVLRQIQETFLLPSLAYIAPVTTSPQQYAHETWPIASTVENHGLQHHSPGFYQTQAIGWSYPCHQIRVPVPLSPSLSAHLHQPAADIPSSNHNIVIKSEPMSPQEIKPSASEVFPGSSDTGYELGRLSVSPPGSEDLDHVSHSPADDNVSDPMEMSSGDDSPTERDSPKSFCSDSNKIPLKKRQLKTEDILQQSDTPQEVTSPEQEITDGQPTKSKQKAKEKDANSSSNNKLLWEFIAELLEERRSEDPVRWIDETSLTFRISDPALLAQMWGAQKHKSVNKMTYEKLSRALRYYYRMNIICKVPGKKLTYRFMTPPRKIKKGIRGAKPGVPHKRRKPRDGTKPIKTTKKNQTAPDEMKSTEDLICSSEYQAGILDLSLKPTKIPPRVNTKNATSTRSKSMDCDYMTMEHDLAQGTGSPHSFSGFSHFSEPSPCALDLRSPHKIADSTQTNLSLPAIDVQQQTQGNVEYDRSYHFDFSIPPFHSQNSAFSVVTHQQPELDLSQSLENMSATSPYEYANYVLKGDTHS